MNKQEAIKLLICEKARVEDVDGNVGGERVRQAYDMAIEALQFQDIMANNPKTAKPTPEVCKTCMDNEQDDWIPVSERLPEEDKDVLVTVHFMGLKQTHPNGWNDHIKPNYYVDIASRIDEEWSSASDEYKIARSRHKTIAWKPLPKPYKGGDTE